MRNPEHYINRELSWLAFNKRVLAQARDESLPLLERLRFLGIWGKNLDEFFQVRVSGLKDQVRRGRSTRTADGFTPAGALVAIRDEVDRQQRRVAKVYGSVIEELAVHGVDVLAWSDLPKSDRKHLTQEFENRIFPVLTPLAVDPGHPFPYISNLSLSLGVILRDPIDRNRRFARLKVPDVLGRFLRLPKSDRFVSLEDVVLAHIDQLFPGMEIIETIAFRVTRNADLDFDEDEASNLLSAVELELRRRRFQQPVRLELSKRMSSDTSELLVNELELDGRDVYVSDVPLDLGDLLELVAIDRPELRDRDHVAVTPPSFRSQDDEAPDLFAAMRERDLLVHHPYESFVTTVEELLAQAANDPAVLAIKMTLYRTSGDSPVVEHLVRAAEAGKQVAVVVELKARFDEAANIGWARRLEDAGVHVAYGLVGLKVHTKTILIVRSEPDGVRRYCHVGTGNYNSRTARLYTDIGLFTSNKRIGNDLAQMFNSLTGYGRDLTFKRLVIAPQYLRGRLVELIANEAKHGSDGHIVMKMNSLVDADLIDRLYAASQAGVTIELVVRGICCLRPGLKGLSDNITVRSIIGRFLEHSRIMVFAHGDASRGGDGDAFYLLGSADLMPRNLDRRVEAMVPIDDPRLRARVDDILGVELNDAHLAWSLDADGKWRRVGNKPETNSQQLLVDMAKAGALR
jgi:polyphosphate kinase